MRVAAIDDEKMALENLLLKLGKISRISESIGFRKPDELLDYLKEKETDIAFLDINMRQINGLSLAKKVKEISPQTCIVFVTGYSEYAVQAFQMHATGYLLKPVSVSDIEDELDHVENLQDFQKKDKGLRVQCFGNFEVFFDGKPLHFKRAKTKELFAYLIDRNGASCNVASLCSILWEDDCGSSSKKSQLRTLLSELTSELEAFNMGNVLIKSWNSYAINPKLINCDYYRYLHMEQSAVNQYHGEYMTQYSWSEMTLGTFDNYFEKL